MSVYVLGIVGESMKNDDGESRQHIIAQCSVGQMLTLYREPDNPYDANAVAVYTSARKKIGYLKRDHAEWVAKRMDDGERAQSLILHILGGTRDKPSYGVVILLILDDFPLYDALWACGEFGGEDEILAYIEQIKAANPELGHQEKPAPSGGQPQGVKMPVYVLAIDGESMKNEDGESRQHIIAQCSAGQMLTLFREPDNPYDAHAVAVYTSAAKKIGYLKRDHAEWIAKRLDDGEKPQSLILRIVGGTRDQPSYGVVILVILDDYPLYDALQVCGAFGGEKEIRAFIEQIRAANPQIGHQGKIAPSGGWLQGVKAWALAAVRSKRRSGS